MAGTHAPQLEMYGWGGASGTGPSPRAPGCPSYVLILDEFGVPGSTFVSNRGKVSVGGLVVVEVASRRWVFSIL